MKKNIGIGILVCIISISLYLVWSAVSNTNDTRTNLPSFSLPEINGNIYTDKQLNLQKPTVVVIVSADCGTCNALLDNFSDKKTDLINPIIITFDKESALKINNRLANKNIKVLICDDSNYLRENFGTSTISSVFVYNSQKELVKHYVGSISPLSFI